MTHMPVQVIVESKEYKHLEEILNNFKPLEDGHIYSKGWKLASYGGGMLHIRDWTIVVHDTEYVIPRVKLKPNWDFLE